MTTEVVKKDVEANSAVDKKTSKPSIAADDTAAADAAASSKPAPRKSVPKPDEAAMKAACDELGAKIEKNKKRLEQIKAVLAERAEKKKSGGSPAMVALKEKLSGLREQFKTELVSRRSGEGSSVPLRHERS